MYFDEASEAMNVKRPSSCFLGLCSKIGDKNQHYKKMSSKEHLVKGPDGGRWDLTGALMSSEKQEKRIGRKS